MNEKLIDKLRKLLALANNNPNEEEATLAMQKAQAIALENDISLSKITNITDKDEIIKGSNEESVNRLSVTQKYVSWIIQDFFGVKIVYSGNRKYGKTTYFIGKPDKVEFAKYLNNYLNNVFMQLWHKYYSANPHISVKHNRISYFLGLHNALSDKLQAQRDQLIIDALPEESAKEQYQLTVLNEKQAIEEAANSMFSDMKKGAAFKLDVLTNAYNDGLVDGKTIEVHSGLTSNDPTIFLE